MTFYTSIIASSVVLLVYITALAVLFTDYMIDVDLREIVG